MDCLFNTKNNKTASLNCHYNIENHKNIKSLSFKTTEIYDEENPIYLSGIDEVELSKNLVILNNKNKKKNILLYVCIVMACALIIVLSLLIYFCIIRKTKQIKKLRKRDIKYILEKNFNEKGYIKTTEANLDPVLYKERIPNSNEVIKQKV